MAESSRRRTSVASASRPVRRRRALMFPRIQKVLRIIEISSRLVKKDIRFKRAHARRTKRQPKGQDTPQLITGIPDEVVSMHILPRLPWYQRPVMKAVSKLWKAAVDETNDIRTLSRELLRNTSVVVLMRSPEFPTLEHFDVTVGLWQALPPLPLGYENEAVNDIFTVDGDLYVVCEQDGQMFRMEMSVGLWSWEVSSVTGINGAVEVAYVSPEGWLHLAGRVEPSSMTYERHAIYFVVRLSSHFNNPFTRICNMKEIDKQVFQSKRDDTVVRYQSPCVDTEIYSLPVYFSETEFYIVRDSRYLEYHDMSRSQVWKVVHEVDLRRKLKMVGNEKVVALASGERCILVATLVFSRFETGKLRLWKGCSSSSHDPGQFSWKLLSFTNRPIEYNWLWSLHDLVLTENFNCWDAIRLVAV